MVDGKAKFFYGATHDEAEAAARATGQHNITDNDTKDKMTLDCYTYIRGGDMTGIAEIVEKSMVVKQVVK